jgi:hypothetical protein
MLDVKYLTRLRALHRTAAIGFVLAGLGSSAALAAPNCAEFFSNSDGSWSPTHPIIVAGPASETRIMPSDRFSVGMPGLSGRIAASLNANCRNEKMPSVLRRIPRVP